MFKSAKLYIWLAIITLVVGALWRIQAAVIDYGAAKYQVGYDKAVQTQQAAIIAAENKHNELLKQSLETAKLEWQKESNTIIEGLKYENSLAESINEIEGNIHTTETGIECIDVGSDVLRLFNAAICTANTGKQCDTPQ